MRDEEIHKTEGIDWDLEFDKCKVLFKGDGASHGDINLYEKQLGIIFDPNYRDFLSKVGYAVWINTHKTGCRLRGICSKFIGTSDHLEFDITSATRHYTATYKSDFLAPWPSGAVALSDNYLLSKSGEIISWPPTPGGREQNYDDFWSFYQAMKHDQLRAR